MFLDGKKEGENYNSNIVFTENNLAPSEGPFKIAKLISGEMLRIANEVHAPVLHPSLPISVEL